MKLKQVKDVARGDSVEVKMVIESVEELASILTVLKKNDVDEVKLNKLQHKLDMHNC